MIRNVVQSVLALALVAVPPCAVWAQQKKSGPIELTVQVYRVVDIVTPAPNYPYEATFLPQFNASQVPHQYSTPGGMGGGMGGGGMKGGGDGMGGGMFQVADHLGQVAGASKRTPRQAQATIDMDSLIRTITTIVDPETWDEVGGPGSITGIGGALAVRQTPEVQQKVREFLEALKEESGRLNTLTVAARWLALDSEQLAQLLGGPDKSTAAGQAIDPAALAALVPKTERFRGQITCFNGQTVHLVSGRMETQVQGAIPVVGPAIGYQPVVVTPHLGVLLQMTPSALPGDDGVLLDVSSTVTRWQEPGKPIAMKSRTEQGDIVMYELDRLNVTAQQFATSLRVPLGKPVLAGGMTFPADGSGADTALGDSSEAVYLVVEVSESAPN